MSGSPRTKVASHFEDLQITPLPTKPSLNGEEKEVEQIAGKRAKRRLEDRVKEIPETPQVDFTAKLDAARTSPFAETPQSQFNFTGSESIMNSSDGAASPPSTSSSPTSSPTTEPSEKLHWQPAEITGHLLLDDPDDDGEGINGIGFKPTAAMARARADKRRRQLAEWKTREDREAREARMRRIEARRLEQQIRNGDGVGGVSGIIEKDREEQRRKVRFADGERAVDCL
jgi:hypothetical protein